MKRPKIEVTYVQRQEPQKKIKFRDLSIGCFFSYDSTWERDLCYKLSDSSYVKIENAHVVDGKDAKILDWSVTPYDVTIEAEKKYSEEVICEKS